MMSANQLDLSEVKQTLEEKNAILPLPLQYLGSKSRISDWILSEIERENGSASDFVDLFAGTGSIAFGASKLGYRVYVNDIQPYSYCLNRAVFKEPRERIDKTIAMLESLKESDLLAGGRGEAKRLLKEEDVFFEQLGKGKFDWRAYKLFCESTPLIDGSKEESVFYSGNDQWNLFCKYYSNTYFGVRQCLQIDAIRQLCQTSKSDVNWNLLAATISAMSYGVSSTTHLAQFLKPTSKKNTEHLIKRRRFDIVKSVIARLKNLKDCKLPHAEVFCGDFKDLFKKLSPEKKWVIYADPPYFKEHYSRYYHLLDTFYLYDYPVLTYNPRTESTTIGRYRINRTVSDFGLKSKVKTAFEVLFRSCKKLNAMLVLSYANTSLLQKKEIIRLGGEAGFSSKIKSKTLLHSGQGQPRNHKVTEYLFIFKPRRN
jgi:adenine-specific DNA-methyltransferase